MILAPAVSHAASTNVTLFPPANLPACTGQMGYLGWDGSGSTACNTGQDMLNGALHCTANQYISYNGTEYFCKTIPACSGVSFLQYNGTDFSCAALPVASCTADQYLTYSNGAFQCVDLKKAPVCTPVDVVVTTGTCSATCGGGTQQTTWSDGCGKTWNTSVACNTQACPPPVTPGSVTFATPGTYTFTVPAYNTFVVQVWGGGGGGGSCASGYVGYANGQAGSPSYFGGIVGYGGGGANNYYNGAAIGRGGSAGGGITNVSGVDGNAVSPHNGGASPNGGIGGNSALNAPAAGGMAPGGGGSGANTSRWPGHGGGGGGYSSMTYSAGQLTIGGTVTVVVGAGGAGAGDPLCPGGPGANGAVVITWQ
jgi:hypothetical protein